MHCFLQLDIEKRKAILRIINTTCDSFFTGKYLNNTAIAIYNFDLFHAALPVNIVILVNVVAPNFLFRNRIVYLVLFLLIIITTNLVYLILACSI